MTLEEIKEAMNAVDRTYAKWRETGFDEHKDDADFAAEKLQEISTQALNLLIPIAEAAYGYAHCDFSQRQDWQQKIFDAANDLRYKHKWPEQL